MVSVVNLVYPSISRLSTQSKSSSRQRRNRGRKQRTHYPVNTMVMLRDMHKTSQSEPTWIGPYRVIQVTRAKTHVLMDNAGTVLKRRPPADHLKLVASAPAPQQQNDESHYVERILDHRGPEGNREYLTRWWGYSSEHDSWTPESNFDDLAIIQRYWESRANAAADGG